MFDATVDHKIGKSANTISKKSCKTTKIRYFDDDTLILLTEGRLSFQDAGSSYGVNPDTVVYVKSGAYIWRESAARGEKYKAVEIAIPRHFIELFLRKHADSMSVCFDPCCDSSYKPVIFPATKVFHEAVKTLCEFDVSDQPEQLKQHKLEEVLLLSLYSCNGHQLATLLRQAALLSSERLRAFMEGHFLNNWRLDKFAQEFGASLTTFKELFSEVYGVSPRSWINDRRLLYAHQLLRSTEKSVVDISLLAGFSSQSYFAQAFRRRFGMAPRQARKY